MDPLNSMVNHHSYHQNPCQRSQSPSPSPSPPQEELETPQIYYQINSNVNTLPNQFVQQHHQSNNILSNWEDINLCCNNQNMFHFLPNSSLSSSSFPCPLPLPLPVPPTQNSSNTNLFTSLGLLGDFLTGPSPPLPPGSVVYDPLLSLNLPLQPPLLLNDHLIQSFPNGYNDNNREEFCGAISQDGEEKNYYENGVFEFKADVKFSNSTNGKGRMGKSGKMPFVNEKQRRVQVKGKYSDLRSLVPNPTKDDRASIVLDAIEYINELKRTVAELKIVVEKKRHIKDNLKRQKLEDGEVDNALFKGEDGGVDQKQSMDGSSTSLRSSWLRRKSKSNEVDVHIIDDEVTVKIVQQKRMNCLIFVSKVFDDLLLDIHHAAGGLIGDSYRYIFNCKICEGSMVYASAIVNKLIEAIS